MDEDGKQTVSNAPSTAEEVHRAERLAISAARKALGLPASATTMGLALSGGGIRSATFNLGILQGLAKCGLLRHIDYLSTVSGGGYIGSWLSAWICRAEKAKAAGAPPGSGLLEVERQLAASVSSACGEPHQIQHLRRYSNYLTPKTGVFGADFWTAIATHARNTLLNFSVLVPALLFVLALPWVLVHALYYFRPAKLDSGTFTSALWMYVLAVLSFAWSFLFAWKSLDRSARGEPGPTARTPQGSGAPPIDSSVAVQGCKSEAWVVGVIASPLFLGSLLLSLAMWNMPPQWGPWHWMALAAVSWCGVLIALELSRELKRRRSATRSGPTEISRLLLSSLAASLLLGLLLYWVCRLMQMPPINRHAPIVMAAGTVANVTAFALAIVLQIGLMGREYSEEIREWWGRLGAWLYIIGGAWVSAFLLAFAVPLLFVWLWGWVQGAIGLGWLASTVSGVLLGRSALTGEQNSSRTLERIALVAPYVFVVGLMGMLAYALAIYLGYTLEPRCYWFATTDPGQTCTSSQIIGHLPSWKLPAVLAVLGGTFLLMSRYIDANLFSYHSFYRNRLVRCYLGASNTARRAHAFTGFDPNDNPTLRELHVQLSDDAAIPQRPFHLVNAALNLTKSNNLAWQERMASSFVFSPLYCGYQLPLDSGRPAYRKTEEYCGGAPRLTLGTALAISGAAASPNAGFHTSKPLAFLMTIFNVRLGWWMPNTGYAGGDIWGRKVLRSSGKWLLRELFGLADENSEFVYLSDGGHFDNLGLYELVRRRCRFIVACDAEADPEFSFQGLAGAIRKCRIDLGIDIVIDTSAIRPASANGRSASHCAVGTIHYERVEPGTATGYLLYIKASLTGDEPDDIKHYAATHPGFPHESTADQWFGESQFESYRKLGYDISRAIFEGTGAQYASRDNMRLAAEDLFVRLRERWYPPSTATRAHFAAHGREMTRIFEVLRADPRLQFLDAQIYPEWERLVAPSRAGGKDQLWLPDDPEAIRSGFYLCNAVIQLMENLYIDLNLEEEYDHPDNSGWMNLFRHWSWAGIFRVTWAISSVTCGSRFKKFCERHLQLPEGSIRMQTHEVDLAAPGAPPAALNFEETRQYHALLKKLAQFGHGEVRLHVFELGISKVDAPADAEPAFTYHFGFAMTTVAPDAHSPPTLFYFRIQDHLRRVGLARKALRVLLEGDRTLELGTVEALAGLAVDPALDWPRFERIFKSVKTDLAQERGS